MVFPSRSRRTLTVNRVLRDEEGMFRFQMTDYRGFETLAPNDKQ
jgi:hypothetical protein